MSINMPAPSTSDLNNSAHVFLAPFVSAMDASAADSSVNATAEAQQNVQIKNIHYDYTATPHVLTEAESLAFLNCFTLQGKGEDDSIAMHFADASGSPVNAAIRAMIEAQEADLEGKLATEVGQNYTATILSVLGVSLTQDLSPAVDLHPQSGADSAVSNLGVIANATTIYLQIPQAQLEAAGYMAQDGSGQLLTAALPLVKGDQIVLVFDVATAPGEITLKYATSSVGLALPTSAGADVVVSETNPKTMGTVQGAYAYHLSAATTDVPARRVAYALQFASGGAAFEVGAGGLKGPHASNDGILAPGVPGGSA